MDQRILKAAQNGNAEAQFRLGYCYSKGDGVEQSDVFAAEWYRKAAVQGHAQAQNNLGTCYFFGRGVPQSYADAAEWYRKAAEQGVENARGNLKICLKKLQSEPVGSYSKNLAFHSLDSTTCEVSGLGSCTDVDLKIPPVSPDGKRVVGVAWRAFLGCRRLTSVVLPDGVIDIGYKAFYGCTGLVSIALPASIKSIKSRAFDDCFDLNYSTYDNAFYLGNPKQPYLFLARADEDACDLSSPRIHPDTRLILPGAFQACENLESVTLPEGLVTIGRYAFHTCESLQKITLPKSLCSIETGAFRYCSSLEAVFYRGSEEQWDKISFGADWDDCCGDYTLHCNRLSN